MQNFDNSLTGLQQTAGEGEGRNNMKICLVAEGCYPYVVGGVSSWGHGLINFFPKQEFIILAIVADRSQRGNFVYELPENVTAVHEVYLNDSDWGKRRRRRSRMSRQEYRALRSLILNQQVDWETLFDLFQKEEVSLNDVLMGEDFLNAVTELYNLSYDQLVFTDFLWMLRSIYLPLFTTLQTRIPKADVYHCVSTGYAGVLGAMAKHLYDGRLMIAEHGVYTREREEELIKANWVQGVFKNIWIEQFQKMSRLAYGRANIVTSLFERAREIQLEEGCSVEKTMIVPNGIAVEEFRGLPGKPEEELDKINVGAVVRVTPVKDLMTLIQAFGFAKEREPALQLFVMGPWEEDEEYARECFDLVKGMNIPDVIFTGRVNVKEYYGKMDMTILTSISEGQPLTILESFAAGKPVIATDVGDCRGLILGDGDEFGEAGIVTHIMNVEEISWAILRLAHNEQMRLQMGENGLRRVSAGYRVEKLRETYRKIYRDFAESMQLVWEEEGN